MQETLQAADGHRLAAYRAAPSGKPRGALVVLQEIFGVNSHIRSVADGYAADGWLAVAPAMFDRAERGVEIGYTPADIERGRALKGGCSNDHALLDIAAAVDSCARPARSACRLLLGRPLAWLAACRQRLAAAVSYYGGGIGELVDLTPRCPVIAHFGERDAPSRSTAPRRCARRIPRSRSTSIRPGTASTATSAVPSMRPARRSPANDRSRF